MQESLAFPRRPAELAALRDKAMQCTRCPLHQGRKAVVFGHGNPQARLVLIGEAPGATEDQEGVPFSGRSGQLLNEVLKDLGIPRGEIWLCNLVLCKTPENRAPLKSEQARCREYLDGQIQAIRPRAIAALGRPAAAALLGQDATLAEIRGLWFDYQGIPWTAAYHPAFVLRERTRANLDALTADLQAAWEKANPERARQPV